MKKRLLNIIYLFVIISIFGLFFLINNQNYIKLREIDLEFVKHPEFLPNKDTVKYTTFGYSNLKADIYWLEVVQYIGGNAMGSEYKKYLYNMLEIITELNPYFEKPYLIGQLLLPNYNERYENLDKQTQKINTLQGETIGLKGIKNFCNSEKINQIQNENDLEKLWSNSLYKEPCKKQDIPSSQAFLYYFYLKDVKKSALYYKVASLNKVTNEGNRIMAAIMSGKSGDREKSIMMFLTLLKSNDEKENEICQKYSAYLQQMSYAIYREGKELDDTTIQELETFRKTYFPFDDKKAEKDIILGNNCNNYLNKAIREFNLQFIENANKKYFEKNKKNSYDAKQLFDEGYIKFLPTDFQQHDGQGIMYYYNEEINNYDYKMKKY